MICERCGSKGRNIRTHVLKVTYESGNGFVYNLCSDCVRDIERFIKAEPRFNAFGYNLDFEKNCKEVYKKDGEWEKYGGKIEAYDIAGNKTWGQKRKCKNCGFIKTYIEDFGIYPICPVCGASMYKEEGEEK